MATNLVGLKFQVGLHEEDVPAKKWKAGEAKYPDFNLVNPSLRRGMDWCLFIDSFGIGMQYDTEYGHREYHVDSPLGEQTCVVAVPQDFATEALAKCPGLTQLTPAEFEDFYDNKAHVSEPEEMIDQDVIDMIETKEKAKLPVPEKSKALDPKTNERGIRKNLDKRWADKKVKVQVDIV